MQVETGRACSTAAYLHFLSRARARARRAGPKFGCRSARRPGRYRGRSAGVREAVPEATAPSARSAQVRRRQPLRHRGAYARSARRWSRDAPSSLAGLRRREFSQPVRRSRRRRGQGRHVPTAGPMRGWPPLHAGTGGPEGVFGGSPRSTTRQALGRARPVKDKADLARVEGVSGALIARATSRPQSAPDLLDRQPMAKAVLAQKNAFGPSHSERGGAGPASRIGCAGGTACPSAA